MVMKIGRRMILGVGLLAGPGLFAACGRSDRTSLPADSASAPSALSAASASSAPSIVFLGTSLTAGLGVDPEQAFPALIQAKVDSAGLHYVVVNAGVSGESSAGALRRMGWLLREKPAVLLIETGANDGLRGQDLDSLRGNIQQIIDQTRATSPATRIVLIGMEALPNLGVQYTRGFRAIYPALAKANNLPLVPFLLDGVAGVDSLNQEDGIHPTPAGHRIAADNVWKVLAGVLREGT